MDEFNKKRLDKIGHGEYYILENGEPKKVGLGSWASWFETNDRTVLKTEIKGVMISTVFMGIDHRLPWDEDVAPLLFETMVFGGFLDELQIKSATLEQARLNHLKVVKQVRDSARWYDAIINPISRGYQRWKLKQMMRSFVKREKRMSALK